MTSEPIPPTATRFIGQRVPRREDRRLLTGRGSYVDDITRPRMLHGAFVRSDVAHGALRGVTVDAARALPGVHAVFRLPTGVTPGLETTVRAALPPFTFSNACHACVVEVDPHTGQVTFPATSSSRTAAR